MNVPRTTPCAKVATNEPPQNARSQKRCSAGCRKRNSKATPRKTSANSMIRIGKYTAGIIIAKGERKGCKQADSAEYQPGCVAVPNRCNRIHGRGAPLHPARHREAFRRRGRSRRTPRNKTLLAQEERSTAVQDRAPLRFSSGWRYRASGAFEW